MAVQTVVIDISQTNVKIKSFDKHIDRLGKSFEKLQRQMDRLNQDKRSTGLSLSQGDTLSKSMEKMTDTMTKLFSNGIKINNPTVNAKVTVDFAKMDIAGQVGNAIKSADIAGTILRNIRLPKTGISSASALKMEMPTKMEVEVTNKEIQVKLPKDFLNGGEKDGKKGFLTKSREKFNGLRGKMENGDHIEGNFEKGLKEKTGNFVKNMNFIGSVIPDSFRSLKNLPRIFGEVKDNFKELSWIKKIGSSKIGKGFASRIGTGIKGLASGIGSSEFGTGVKGVASKIGIVLKSPVVKGVASGVGGVATAGIATFSIALKGLTGIVKGVAGVIKGVINVFQGIFSIASSVWGQVQKWAINPLVGAQNQMSQNKGYWKLLGGQEGAESLDNKIVDMAVKGPYAYESVEGAVRKLVNTGMSQDKALEVTWNYSNMAAAKSLDEEGMMQGIDSYIQANSGEYVTVDDFNSAANVADPATLAKHLLGVEKAGEKEIEQAKELISTQSISKEKFIDAIGKMGKEYIGLSKEFGGGYESIAEEVASTTYSGITAKIKNIFQGDIVRKWGTGLSDGLAEGLGKFASWLDENRETFAAWGEQLKSIGREIGQYITNFLQNTGERIKSVFNSTEFQQADLSDKIVIFWDKVIKDPFSEWWQSTGASLFQNALFSVGKTITEFFSGVIKGLFGSDLGDVVGEGAKLGIKFAQGFLSGIDFTGLATSIVTGILKGLWNISGPGMIVNGIIDWFNNGGEEEEPKKVLPNSIYSNHMTEANLLKTPEPYESYSIGFADPEAIMQIEEQRKEDKKRRNQINEEKEQQNFREQSVREAQEMEYNRTEMHNYAGKNEVIEVLYKKANDAEWEYENNEKIRDEALANGDKEAAGIAEMKMTYAQEEMNAARRQLHEIYPGIITSENMALGVMKERLDKQKELNEEMRKGKLVEMQNTLAVKEDSIEKYKGGALEHKAKADETYAKYSEFNDNADGFMVDFLGWSKLNQAVENAKNGDLKGDEKKAAVAKAEAAEEAAKEGLTTSMTVMGFNKDEINAAFVQEKEGGYTGETVNTMIQQKGEELRKLADEAQALYEGAMAVLQEVLIAKDELAANEIQELTSLSPEELMDPKKWGDLDDNMKTQVLGIIGEVNTLNGKLNEFGLTSAHKEIFIDILETYKKVGEDGQLTTGGQPTTPTSTTGGAKIWTIQDTINALGFGTNDKKANGDILTSPHIALVAEAGPEAIIPLSKGRRARGLELWEQAGAMMGVYPHADGGMFGSFAAPKQVSPLYQQMEESKESSEQAENEMGAPARVDIGGINVSLGGFTFYGTEANSREGIMSVIKEQMPDIADEIAGTIAVNIQRIFANMKLQTA